MYTWTVFTVFSVYDILRKSISNVRVDLNYRNNFLNVTIIIHICMAFCNVLDLAEAAFCQKH